MGCCWVDIWMDGWVDGRVDGYVPNNMTTVDDLDKAVRGCQNSKTLIMDRWVDG